MAYKNQEFNRLRSKIYYYYKLGRITEDKKQELFREIKEQNSSLKQDGLITKLEGDIKKALIK